VKFQVEMIFENRPGVIYAVEIPEISERRNSNTAWDVQSSGLGVSSYDF